MEYDVAMVGAGPAGLAAAIRLKQLSKERGVELSVCVLEKGAEVGSHILSGAVTCTARVMVAVPHGAAQAPPRSVCDFFLLFLSKNEVREGRPTGLVCERPCDLIPIFNSPVT